MSPGLEKARRCGYPYPGKALELAGSPMVTLEEIPIAAGELESLRLCDLLGCSQKGIAEQLGVSRGTVQRLVKGTRRKVARVRFEGNAVIFDPDEGWSGGDSQ